MIVTPGQDTLLTVRNTLLGARRAGVFTAMGVSTGQAAWALATSVGLAALLSASEPAFVAIKLAGAAYLILLGVQTLIHALRREPVLPTPGSGAAARARAGSAFRQGLISNLGNPKMAVFFTSLLPQFTTGGSGSFLSLLALGLLFSLMTLIWLGAYAVALAQAGRVLQRPRVRRAIDAVAGAVLVALGVRLATEQR